jgi:hypothetical protein
MFAAVPSRLRLRAGSMRLDVQSAVRGERDVHYDRSVRVGVQPAVRAERSV